MTVRQQDVILSQKIKIHLLEDIKLKTHEDDKSKPFFHHKHHENNKNRQIKFGHYSLQNNQSYQYAFNIHVFIQRKKLSTVLLHPKASLTQTI